MRKSSSSAVLLLASLLASSAFADRYELLVYSDELPKQGEAELEEVLSLARPRDRSAFPSSSLWQSHTELNYGLGKGWEIGLEAHATASGNRTKYGGLAAEVQYVADQDDNPGWYWGVRLGVGRQASFYEGDWLAAIDINPVIGYRGGNLHFVLNPSVEIPLGSSDGSTSFQPSAKASWQLNSDGGVGLEYYGDWGKLKSLTPSRQRAETLYLVWDGRASLGTINVGFGRALRSGPATPDRWVAKIGVQFDLD